MSLGKEKSVQRSGRRGALAILRRVRSGEMQPEEVCMHERRICVAYLRLEGYTAEEIAEIFDVHRQTISRDQKALRQEAGRLVDEMDARSVSGGLIAWARHLTARALKAKDMGLAWKIQKELVGELRALGYLPQAVARHDVHVGAVTTTDMILWAQNRKPRKPLAELHRAAPEPPKKKAESNHGEDDGGQNAEPEEQGE